MASTIDYQKLYDRYQTEGLPRQISIVKFCEQNGVPYKQYENWYKRCRGGRAVQVSLVDSESPESSGLVQDGKLLISSPAEGRSRTAEKRIQRIEIVFRDGMRVRRTDLDYALILETVQKLSPLC